jgi:hypothetical protein
MKNKRGIKHYIRFYVLAVVLYFAYISYIAYQTGGYDSATLLSVGYIPLLFIVFLYFFDTIMDIVMPSQKTKKEDEYTSFIKFTTQEVNNQGDFSIEDFRRLRESDKFQKALFQAFHIKKDGETDEFNFIMLEKKFKRGSREHQAITIVIKEVKKMMVN